jgi:hypothetical protein
MGWRVLPYGASTVFVSSIGGSAPLQGTRTGLAALNRTSGAQFTWYPKLVNPPNNSTAIFAMDLQGTTLYIGGIFATAGSATPLPRSNAAAVSVLDGSVGTWAPNPISQVNTLFVSGSSVFVGGSFAGANAYSRDGLAAFDTSTGQLLSSVSISAPSVAGIRIDGTTLYLAGGFLHLVA